MYVTSYQIDLRTANAELTPDFLFPVKEYLVDPESRIQNYVPLSPNTDIWVVGKMIICRQRTSIL